MALPSNHRSCSTLEEKTSGTSGAGWRTFGTLAFSFLSRIRRVVYLGLRLLGSSRCCGYRTRQLLVLAYQINYVRTGYPHREQP